MNGVRTSNLKKRLVRGLGSWLSFELCCERGRLFSEFYLAHAVGPLLQAHYKTVRAEFPHPALERAHKRGRKPSIDYVCIDEGGNTQLAVEIKWAGMSDVTAKALLWDTIRLSLFASETGARGLLVFAGTQKRVRSLLDSAAFRQEPGKIEKTASPLLPLANGGNRLTVKHSALQSTHQDFLQEQYAKYSIARPPKIVRCHPPVVFSTGGPKALAFDVYAWQVEAYS